MTYARTGFAALASLLLIAPAAPAVAGTAKSDREHKMRQVSGEVIQTKQIEVRGANQTNLVALLKTKQGDDRLAVDLGKADAIQGKLQGNLVGKQIAAEGRVVELRDRVFLVARRAKIDGQTVQIDRQAQQQHARAQDRHRPQQKRRQVSGTIVNAKTVDVRGTDAKNVVAMIRTQKADRRLIVDLGSTANLDVVDVATLEGKKVQLEGKLIELGDEQVLVTDRFRIAGGQVQQVKRQQDEHAKQHAERQRQEDQRGDAPTAAIRTGS